MGSVGAEPEGLAFPGEYAGAQLSGFSETDQKRIMGDNLENFLAPCLQ